MQSRLGDGFGRSSGELNARRVKLVPSAVYTKMTTSYPNAALEYISAIGGVSSTIMAVLGFIHGFHLKFFARHQRVAVGP